MQPAPTVVGMFLCDHVIIEEKTRKASVIGAFNKLGVPRVPALHQPFFVFVQLIDGTGTGTVQLVVTHLATDQEVYAVEGVIEFPNRLLQLDYRIKLTNCIFPFEGKYLFTLLVDDVLVSQRELVIQVTGGS